MLKRLFTTTLPLAIITMLVITSTVVAAQWWYDVHYVSDLYRAYYEANTIRNYLDGKVLNGALIRVYVLRDWYKSWIINYSLPYAKVFHIASHGDVEWEYRYQGDLYYGLNFLITHYGERIYGRDVPYLGNVFGEDLSY